MVKCIKFNEGPHKGQYGYFSNSTADARVKEGIAEYYDPESKKEVKEESEPESDIPKDLPGREHFEGKSFDDVKKLAEKGNLKKVPGIGKSTENKIKEYLDGHN